MSPLKLLWMWIDLSTSLFTTEIFKSQDMRLFESVDNKTKFERSKARKECYVVSHQYCNPQARKHSTICYLCRVLIHEWYIIACKYLYTQTHIYMLYNIILSSIYHAWSCYFHLSSYLVWSYFHSQYNDRYRWQ